MFETCAIRCPHDINITKIMDAFKIMAQKEGVELKVPSIPLFWKSRKPRRGPPKDSNDSCAELKRLFF
jgi:hypothetical protein